MYTSITYVRVLNRYQPSAYIRFSRAINARKKKKKIKRLTRVNLDENINIREILCSQKWRNRLLIIIFQFRLCVYDEEKRKIARIIHRINENVVVARRAEFPK